MSYRVSIYVVNDAIVVRPDHLVMNKSDCDVEIAFKLQTPGYVFPQTPNYGIDIDDSSDEFDQYTISTDRRRVHLVNKNNNEATYKYSVQVLEEATGKPLDVDPTIENRGK